MLLVEDGCIAVGAWFEVLVANTDTVEDHTDIADSVEDSSDMDILG